MFDLTGSPSPAPNLPTTSNNPSTTAPKPAAADPGYTYQVFLTTIHWDEDEDEDGEELIRTFDTLEEANKFAETEALNENYDPETWRGKTRRSVNKNGLFTIEMDEIYTETYTDYGAPCDSRESARVEVRRKKRKPAKADRDNPGHRRHPFRSKHFSQQHRKSTLHQKVPGFCR